ncbi:MAG: beta-lactamase family protein, partial [Nonomuraea sp.]|nr:beta-lactamase family protein [Nonomuraea sp.]
MTSNDRLQRAIEDVVETGFVGVTLHVREGQHTWSGSAGLAELGGTDRPPLDGHVRIGSNTKTFTAALVLQLVAEGGLGLDDPAADHLPALGLDGRITVRMLLQHTSGLFNFTGEVLPDGTLVPGTPAPYGPRARAWVDDRFGRHQPEDLVRQALANPARFEPGTDWSYSNTNYVLLRLLIEHVTGNPLTEELRRRILGPLGLTGTSIPDGSPDLPEPHPHAYYRLDDQAIDITRHDPSWISTGGDMISTTRDLAVFVSALLDGRLLPYELVA